MKAEQLIVAYLIIDRFSKDLERKQSHGAQGQMVREAPFADLMNAMHAEIHRLKNGPLTFIEAAKSGRPFRRIGDKPWTRLGPQDYWLETKRGAVWQSEYMMKFPVSYVLECNFEIMPEGDE